MSDQSRYFRTLAVFLALCASGWGLFCGLFIAFGDPIRSLLILGPGYAVTLGYWWRVWFPTRTSFRRTIWAASTLVQGAWLAGVSAMIFADGRGSLIEFVNPFTAWWIFAFATSVYGLVADKNPADDEELFPNSAS